MRRLWTHVAALVGAFIGFYGGLIALLDTRGLGSADLAPLFMCAGAGLLAGAAVALVGESATAWVAGIGLAGGLVLGAILTAIDPDLTVIAVLLAVYSQVLASIPHAGELEGSSA